MLAQATSGEKASERGREPAKRSAGADSVTLNFSSQQVGALRVGVMREGWLIPPTSLSKFLKDL